ncbi:MAG: hypothetical protein J6M12_03230 [Clostridia bacterium]|nr:hypothetical protein [Clostridia bacterium]
MNKLKRRTWQLWLFWLFIGMLAFCLLRSPASCGEWIKRGVQTALLKALPSVFPYLVLSSLFFKSGFPLLFQGRVARLLARLFYLPPICISGLVVGLFAGFPLGASFAASLYTDGYCSKEQAERLASLSDFCAPPFLLTAFGVGVMGDLRAGLLLFAVQTVSVFFYGLISGQCVRKREKKVALMGEEKLFFEERLKLTSYPSTVTLLTMVSAAIGEGALQMVRIGGYILFFSLVSGLALSLCTPLILLFPSLEGLIAGVFEISTGVAHMKKRGAEGMFFGALSLCWSGVSVHLQVASCLGGAGLSPKKHIVAHLILAPTVALLSSFLFVLLW